MSVARETRPKKRVSRVGTVRAGPLFVRNFEPDLVETLATRLRRTERLHLCATGDLATQIAASLTELHKNGAVHGEVSPGNITITLEEEPERLTMVGLGHLTAQRGARSFPEPEAGYASPETLLGFSPDERVDCWAFGVLLYRCAYGRLPFRARSPEELLAAFSRPAAVPDGFGESTDALLTGFFERCFAHRSASRFQSARTIGSTFAALVSEAQRISHDPFSFQPKNTGRIVPIGLSRGRL